MQDGLSEAKSVGLPLRIMFQDEARFGRINEPKRCWCRAGVRPSVGKQIVREYVYAYGAFSPKDGAADFLILPFMDSENMNLFLNELSIRHENELILLICDKAPCHSKEALDVPNNIIPSCNQYLMSLLVGSPILYASLLVPTIILIATWYELNPSENMWDEVREKFFTNLVFDSLDAVMDKLEEAMIFYQQSPQIVKSITGFNWIIPHI